jgi:hypothetical protein
MNMSIEVVDTKGAWFPMFLDELGNQTIDMFALTFERNARREKKFGFSVPLYEVREGIALFEGFGEI